MKIPRKPRKKARIEIIPMIDTMFFLLVFFMLAALAMTAQNTLPVALPQAAGVQDRNRPAIVLTVTKDGKLFCDGEQAGTPAEAARWLVQQSQGDNQISVIINADSGVEHGRVVALMAAIRQQGIDRIAIGVQPDGPGAAAR
ncbi:ExbD/TolR family protein [Sporomusa termitida]|uniref:TolR: protein TolR n=1 Tax=Sporomusa termitida TaxID=2377 RepID=A0A517DRB9_9FIRM|nr:biopolymer transporter ExbD [Sporomusa termitida]QDR79867.1 tolR: protein TolR [Sporomusa termitida]